MNTENSFTSRVIGKGFTIYRAKFPRQFIITIIINMIYLAITAFIIWYGFFVVIPNAPEQGVTDVILGNLPLIVICGILILVTLIFKYIVTGANIIVAHYEESLIGSLIKTLKSIPRMLSVLTAQIIVCLPFLIAWGYIVYKTQFNKIIPLASSLVIAVLFFLFDTLSMLAVPYSQSDNKYFIKPMKYSFNMAKANLLKFLGVKLAWLLIYWGFYMLIFIIVGFIFPAPSFFAKIPSYQYIVPFYHVFIAYLLTMFVTPVSKNILYALYSEINATA